VKFEDLSVGTQFTEPPAIPVFAQIPLPEPAADLAETDTSDAAAEPEGIQNDNSAPISPAEQFIHPLDPDPIYEESAPEAGGGSKTTAETEFQNLDLDYSWTEVSDPRTLLKGDNKSAVTSECSGCFARKEDGIVYLSVPLREDEEFPMMPVFCLGEPETVNGEVYLVFKIIDGILSV